MATQLDQVTRSNSAEVSRTDTQQASFKVYSGDRIPVSENMGTYWKGHRDDGLALLEKRGTLIARTNAIRYFNNDQQQHRTEYQNDKPQNMATASTIQDRFSETENVVYANTVTLARMLYVRNPDIEISPIDGESEEDAIVARNVKRLVNVLLQKQTCPGLNLKKLAKRAIINCALTNKASVILDYVFRTPADEQAVKDLESISRELGDPTTSTERIRELDGQLQAMEEAVSFLRPPGPQIRFIDPRDLIKEFDAYGNPRWMMFRRYEQTAWIQAKFAEAGPLGKNHSIYRPSHLLKPVADGSQENIDSLNQQVATFKLFEPSSDEDWRRYGYTDEKAFKNSQYTLVWYVWDKTTRRVLMFSNQDWSWPIWVANDPYKLEEFFPIYELEFYQDPEGFEAKGEVSYYLDQQDGINEVASERRRARLWARRNAAYDTDSVERSEVENFLNGTQNVLGIKVKEGMDIKTILQPILPPSAQVPGLLDDSAMKQAIDRISSVNQIATGGEFRTNTTNEAIERYEATQGVNLEDKIDAVEDWIGAIGWGLAQMCIMYMDQQQVSEIIGPRMAATWVQIQDPAALRGLFNARVVGGSTQKPTSRQKQQAAIQIGQVVGQFASATPAAVIIALKVMERAFDEVVITEEDWQFIRMSLMQALAAPAPNEGEEGPPARGDNVTPIEQGAA